LKQPLDGGQSAEPVSATRLAPVSRQGFALQILAEQFTRFMRKLLQHALTYMLCIRQVKEEMRRIGNADYLTGIRPQGGMKNSSTERSCGFAPRSAPIAATKFSDSPKRQIGEFDFLGQFWDTQFRGSDNSAEAWKWPKARLNFEYSFP
jgi:hypothetical protein